MSLKNILIEIRELGAKKVAEEFSGITGWGKKKTFNTMFAPVTINFIAENEKYSLIVEKNGVLSLNDSNCNNADCSFEGAAELLEKLFTDRTRATLSELESTGRVKLLSVTQKGKEALSQLRKLFN